MQLALELLNGTFRAILMYSSNFLNVSRNEHNAGCVYVCVKTFRKVPHFMLWYKDYYRILIANFLSSC